MFKVWAWAQWGHYGKTSEPWATLAQLSLIFAQFFAYAGRVVKRHGLITGVEAPTAGPGTALDLRPQISHFEFLYKN